MLLPLAIFTSVASTGCTAIGFGAGALIDMTSGKGPPSRLAGVRSGVEITMWLRDGSKLNGIYRGRQALSAETVTSAQAAGGDSLAAPSRSVILLETRSGTQAVPVDDVWRVSVPVARGKVIGTLLGMGIDALVVGVEMAAIDWGLEP